MAAWVLVVAIFSILCNLDKDSCVGFSDSIWYRSTTALYVLVSSHVSMTGAN